MSLLVSPRLSRTMLSFWEFCWDACLCSQCNYVVAVLLSADKARAGTLPTAAAARRLPHASGREHQRRPGNYAVAPLYNHCCYHNRCKIRMVLLLLSVGGKLKKWHSESMPCLPFKDSLDFTEVVVIISAIMKFLLKRNNFSKKKWFLEGGGGA